MSDPFLLGEAQMRRVEPYFPLSHGIARGDAPRVISGIIFVIRNGVRERGCCRLWAYQRRVTLDFSRLGKPIDWSDR